MKFEFDLLEKLFDPPKIYVQTLLVFHLFPIDHLISTHLQSSQLSLRRMTNKNFKSDQIHPMN